MDREDFRDTDVGASDEVTFNIAHQDEGGIIHYDVVRTTLSVGTIKQRQAEFRRASELYYHTIGHKVVHIQMRTEVSKLLKGKPRLKILKGGLLGAVLAVSAAVAPGAADVDGWLSDAEMAAEVACLERRHGMPRRTALNHDVFGPDSIYG